MLAFEVVNVVEASLGVAVVVVVSVVTVCFCGVGVCRDSGWLCMSLVVVVVVRC